MHCDKNAMVFSQYFGQGITHIKLCTLARYELIIIILALLYKRFKSAFLLELVDTTNDCWVILNSTDQLYPIIRILIVLLSLDLYRVCRRQSDILRRYM